MDSDTPSSQCPNMSYLEGVKESNPPVSCTIPFIIVSSSESNHEPCHDVKVMAFSAVTPNIFESCTLNVVMVSWARSAARWFRSLTTKNSWLLAFNFYFFIKHFANLVIIEHTFAFLENRPIYNSTVAVWDFLVDGWGRGAALQH